MLPNWHILLVSFNANQWFTVGYSDTLLEALVLDSEGTRIARLSVSLDRIGYWQGFGYCGVDHVGSDPIGPLFADRDFEESRKPPTLNQTLSASSRMMQPATCLC